MRLRLPERIATERLVLRCWRPADAPRLKDAIDSSLPHLRPWMPWALTEPTPLPQLAERLATFAADFAAGRAWFYGIFVAAEDEVFGGCGLHPRSVTTNERADASAAEACIDRLEIGYWLRADATHRGYASEASRALLGAALSQPGIVAVEIRCDPENVGSAAVPRRLGFRLVRTIRDDPVGPDGQPRETMVWEHDRRG
jgi:RimJ/RimL family protein N-acetyltransferase